MCLSVVLHFSKSRGAEDGCSSSYRKWIVSLAALAGQRQDWQS
jgi:hypothetical protein